MQLFRVERLLKHKNSSLYSKSLMIFCTWVQYQFVRTVFNSTFPYSKLFLLQLYFNGIIRFDLDSLRVWIFAKVRLYLEHGLICRACQELESIILQWVTWKRRQSCIIFRQETSLALRESAMKLSLMARIIIALKTTRRSFVVVSYFILN